MKTPRSERRLKRLYADPKTVLDSTLWYRVKPDFITLECFDLPSDFEICGIDYIIERDQFGFIIASGEFPIVPSNTIIPELVIKRFSYELKRAKK